MLPKENRLKLKNDFQNVFRGGGVWRTSDLIVRVAANKEGGTHFGFIISKKINKKAVVRNRLRRQMAEVVRRRLKNIRSGFDAVIVAKKEIVDKPFAEIEGSIEAALKKAGLSSNS
jgi:ribonuclease P protein component